MQMALKNHCHCHSASEGDHHCLWGRVALGIGSDLSQLWSLTVEKWGPRVPLVIHEWTGGVWLAMKMGRSGNKACQQISIYRDVHWSFAC